MAQRYRIKIRAAYSDTIIWQGEREATEEHWPGSPVPQLLVSGAGPGGTYYGDDGKPAMLTFDEGDDDSAGWELLAAHTTHDVVHVTWERIATPPEPAPPGITPALTPEQWAAYQAGETIEYRHTENERIRINPTQARPRFPHLSVALGNAALEDGDGRKLTPAMVDAIREAAQELRGQLRNPHWRMADDRSMAEYAARQCEAAADALASILPPREG